MCAKTKKRAPTKTKTKAGGTTVGAIKAKSGIRTQVKTRGATIAGGSSKAARRTTVGGSSSNDGTTTAFAFGGSRLGVHVPESESLDSTQSGQVTSEQKKTTKSEVKSIVSTYILLICVVSQLCTVRCEIVGNGHTLKGNEVEVLNKNAKTDCDVFKDDSGNIILKYKKDTVTSNAGCVLDLLMKKPEDGRIKMEVGVKTTSDKDMTKCLADAVATGITVKHENVGDTNMLPFYFSLKNREKAEAVKIDDNSYCSYPTDCRDNRKSYCLKKTAYAVAFARKGDKHMMYFVEPRESYLYFFSFNLRYYIFAVGEARMWYCAGRKESSIPKSSNFELILDTAKPGWTIGLDRCERQKGLDMEGSEARPTCFKTANLRKPELWKITDKSHTDKDYTHLFTMHILPQREVHRHKTGEKQNQAIDWDNRLDGKTTPNCDEMYIKFDKNNFKLLGNDPPPPTLASTDSTPPTESTTSTDPPETKATEAASGGNLPIIIGVVVGLLIL
uniref:Uncharacterized protein n=1 Tax=Meloidogyne hapla TaxID=6305 RepID=A0A1I8BBB8_MELHA